MRNFGLSIFGGYRKDEVDEYIEHLVEELETWKDKRDEADQKLQTRVKELEQKLEEKQRELELQKEKQDREAQERRLLEEQKKALQERERELEEKIKEYEAHSDSVNRVLSLAEKTVYEAKTEAEKIVTEGKEEVDVYRGKAEELLDKKRRKNEDEFMLAKYKLMSYLKSLNNTQNKLVKAYNELGALVERLPLRIGDILSEEPFELLEEETEKKKA